jgi:hypothetical protein
MFGLILAFVAGAGAMYALNEPEKQKLRKTATVLERHAQVQEDRIRTQKDAHRRLALQNFQTLLKYYVERLQRLAATSGEVNLQQGLRLHVIVLRLQDLHAAGGDPTAMSADDQRYCRFLHVLMDDSVVEVDEVEFEWFESYGLARHPDAAREFLLDSFLRQKRRIEAELAELRATSKNSRSESRVARMRFQVEGGAENERLADMHDARRAVAETKIAELEARDQDIKRNLVIVYRICRPDSELDRYDHTARDILERLAGLRGEAQQNLTPEERVILDAYRERYALEVSAELEEKHQVQVV